MDDDERRLAEFAASCGSGGAAAQELTFPGLSATHRKRLHDLADKHGLAHATREVDGGKVLVVWGKSLASSVYAPEGQSPPQHVKAVLIPCGQDALCDVELECAPQRMQDVVAAALGLPPQQGHHPSVVALLRPLPHPFTGVQFFVAASHNHKRAKPTEPFNKRASLYWTKPVFGDCIVLNWEVIEKDPATNAQLESAMDRFQDFTTNHLRAFERVCHLNLTMIEQMPHAFFAERWPSHLDTPLGMLQSIPDKLGVKLKREVEGSKSGTFSAVVVFEGALNVRVELRRSENGPCELFAKKKEAEHNTALAALKFLLGKFEARPSFFLDIVARNASLSKHLPDEQPRVLETAVVVMVSRDDNDSLEHPRLRLARETMVDAESEVGQEGQAEGAGVEGLPHESSFRTILVDAEGNLRSDLLKRITTKGAGRRVLRHDRVNFRYKCTLHDSNRLVHDFLRDTQTVGQDTMLPGLDLALLSMSEGEAAEFVVAPRLAFGEAGLPPEAGDVPPNATLRFEVVLDEILSEEKGVRLSPAEKFALAKDSYANGRELFALQRYNKAYSAFVKAGNAADGARDKLQGEQSAEVEPLVDKSYHNALLCCIKTEDYDKLLSSKALERLECLGLMRAKTFYFRGKALAHQHNLEDAISDLTEAQRLDPHDALVAGALHDARRRLAKANQREQHMFGGVFERMQQAYGEEDERAEAQRKAEARAAAKKAKKAKKDAPFASFYGHTIRMQPGEESIPNYLVGSRGRV